MDFSKHKWELPELGGVIEGVSGCLSIKMGLLYRTKLKLDPTKLGSSSPPPTEPDNRPALSADPFVTVEVIFLAYYTA